MKHAPMIFFFTVFGTLWFLVNFYIFRHGWNALPQASPWRTVYLTGFLYFALAYILSRILDRMVGDNFLVNFLSWTGSYWFAALLYLFLAVFLIDLARLSNHFIPWYPSFVTRDYPAFKLMLLGFTAGIVVLILLAGTINAALPVLRKVPLHINKNAPVKELKIAMASDIHFGTMIRQKKLNRLVQMMNDAKPDIIILAGDLMEEQKPWIKRDLGAPLRNLKAPLGVWAVTGNHEYINGVVPAVHYFENLGIKMLRDTVVNPAGWFLLAGRDDKDEERFSGKRRKPLLEILNGTDSRLPLILVDHQPLRLKEAIQAGVDLQLSGHTHDGQMWPFNYLIDAMYEVGHGYLKKDNFQIYVSNGYGTWGPPVRIGNRPEVVLLTLQFDGANGSK